MIRLADAQPEIGCLGPRLLARDGLAQRSCWRGYPGLAMAVSDAFYLWKAPWLPLARRSEYSAAELAGPLDVDHLLGACLLIRRAAWEQAGELDEGYFLFLEETDWCYRAKRLGWRIVYDPQATVTHLGEHSVNQAPTRNLPHFYRSYCRFFRKHVSAHPAQVLLLKQIIVAAALVRIVLWTMRAGTGRGSASGHARAMRAGYVQVLKSLPGF
jgi:GT2 family glycosyltransferase